jgi:SNF2 family DNA or RNA helicase
MSSVKNVIAWANMFDVTVDNEIMVEATHVEEKTNQLIEASRSTDAVIVIDKLQGELLPYQRAGVQYASDARRTFIADEMGLGKTIQAICTVEYVMDSYPVVVVCPPSLVLNWAKEWNKWLPERKVVTVTNRKVFPDEGTYDVVVVGYSNIPHWEKRLTGHRSYIFDESHYCKTPTAQRTKSAVKIARSAPKEGLVLCLTGTPVTNRPNEYASQLEILGRLKEFGGLWGFYRRYCAAYQDSFGQWNISGNSHLDELNDRLRGACYIRRTKDQVLSELPPVLHSRLVVEGSSAGMKEYIKAEKDILFYIAERARQLAIEQGKPSHKAAMAAMIRAEANEHLVRLSILRRLAAKAKMDSVHEWVDAHIEDGKKVVIAAHHREIVDELSNKYGNLRIQGGMSVDEVELNKQKFQELSVEKAPVIVLSMQAAKTGHTLTASENCLFVELPWTPADVDQTYSRLHRLGQKGSVSATYLLAANTIDEDIYDLIEKKRSVVDAAVEGGEVSSINSTVQMIMGLFDRAR